MARVHISGQAGTDDDYMTLATGKPHNVDQRAPRPLASLEIDTRRLADDAALRLAELALAECDRSWIPVHRSWRLNERHYGALQGKNKQEVAEEFGADQVKIWRRSYDVAPPPLDWDAGADPRFVVRRMLRMASEDIGMADPRALEQVAAVERTVEHVGMPECELALAQAAVYLALAAQSNALYTAYGKVKREVAQRPGLAVPMAIRNAPTELMKGVGYGEGYRYAHDEEGAVADLECLPEELADARFYQPTEYGWEKRIRERMAEIRQFRAKRPKKP